MDDTDRYASLSDELLQRVHAACEGFERALHDEEPICIEDCIAAASEEIRIPLFRELLAIEVERRVPREVLPHIADYHARFPERSDEIKRVFQEVLAASRADDLPQEIGRYRVENVLGTGAFGRVYLAHDEELMRLVAIKVPHATLVARPEDASRYLTEARTVASLDHPHIVPVQDVGSTEDCPCYIVFKYVNGSDLATRIKQSRLSYTVAAELVATIAEALHYAHTHGLVHRDVKPGNILIDTEGKPYLVDFGLALQDHEPGGCRPGLAGTPHYMSPEQARGEGHRVDGRSDIYSLGAVFYELLAGRRTFSGLIQTELLERIATQDPRPPRQIDDRLPKELERICLKALSRRASERYTTALDMAEDLRHFLETDRVEGGAWRVTGGDDARLSIPPTRHPPPSTLHPLDSDSTLIKVIPKGLRSFDKDDADFFLELLPGPRDRDGLPGSLRFWKARIEEADADRIFSVGLIYGPSGCGKSSLVQAGLLPRLSENVKAVYVEATPEGTEARLLGGLRKRVLGVSTDLDLKQTLEAIRLGHGVPAGQKVLIVLDQFEQWLHAHKVEENPELVQALRQCDGGRVQCIVMVRDDFWLAVSRFMLDLEVDLVPGRNIALVDLFDLDHARKILAAFGRAFDRLPQNRGETSQAQKDFLKQVIKGLAQDGKVVCVRLALFAEMLKGKPWTTATLHEVGGTQGVGVTFLDETFSARTASPKHHRHQKAARAVLSALLPDSGANIKGRMRSHSELLEVSGYSGHVPDFDELIRILDNEVRLITPTEVEEIDHGDSAPRGDSGDRYYQLTHDYLVRSLREWLTSKQKETRRGRAELRLAERSAEWNAKPEDRHLPSLSQWCRIRWLTQKKSWTPPERKMMGRAARYHAVRAAAVAMLLAVATITGLSIRKQGENQRKANFAAGLVRSLLNADTVQVPAIVVEMAGYREWADPLLKQANDRPAATSRQKLHASLALLPADPTQVDYLCDRLLEAEPLQVPVIRDALAGHKDALRDGLWAVAETPEKGKEPQRLRAASALAKWDSESEKWATVREAVANDLVAAPPVYLTVWMEALRPVKERLLSPLSAVYRETDRRETERSLATDILADYAADNPQLLADLLMDADDKQFAVIYPKLEEQGERAMPVLTGEIDKERPADLPSSDRTRERLAKRQANAAVAALRMNHPETVWPLLKHSSDPRVRSYLIHRLYPMGADPNPIINRLEAEPDITIRRALLLSLGEYREDVLPLAARQALLPRLQSIYRTDADPGLHASAEWLLRTWNQAGWLKQVNEEWATASRGAFAPGVTGAARPASAPGAKPRWYVNGQRQTMVVVPGPVEFLMGSPPSEVGRDDDEVPHKTRISRTFALAAKAVTVEQYRKFEKDYQLPARQISRTLALAGKSVKVEQDREFDEGPQLPAKGARAGDLPVVAIPWYMAARYCNWLSVQEAIPQEQWCYEIKGDVIQLKDNYLSLTGYRLPTEAEMEYVTRAGALTSRYYGETEELLPRYAWYQKNAQERSWPVGSLKPNDLGMFDVHGNTFTWCQESYQSYRKVEDDAFLEDKEDVLSIEPTANRVLRGGSFIVAANFSRSACRNLVVPTFSSYTFGFRLARTLLSPRLPRPER